jgi:queuine tRNA-ribosyltransferase
MEGLNNMNIKTPHGEINTPFFMPDATRGFIKSCSNDDLIMSGVEAMVVNTFHLYLQPGVEAIKKAGGIHNFMNWQKPLVSDSGGFQIFSLIHKNSKMGKITDEGAFFKSPLDGSYHEITPEKSIQIQFDLGTDFIVCLDDCPPYAFIEKDIENSVNRTIAWARRCHREYIEQIKKRKLKEEDRPKLIAVVQGGLSRKLRKKCLDGLLEVSDEEVLGERIPFAAYGFGGRPVDENGDFLYDILEYTAKIIPEDSLKFALGIGTPEDIVRCYKMGWNMFDCVIPTREARHAKLYQFKREEADLQSDFYKEMNLKNNSNILNTDSINKDSEIKELQENSLSYLHHLFKMNESKGHRLATLNNLEFYNKMIKLLK